MKLKKLNEPLIKKVVQHIEKFPEAYNQNIVSQGCVIDKKRPCGAIGCFGGWAVLLSMPMSRRHRAAENLRVSLYDAMRKLGLTNDESDLLFEEATSIPEKDLQIIKRRLEIIREARLAFKLVGHSMGEPFIFEVGDGAHSSVSQLEYY